MKCSMTEDLLPLYVDDMCSEETKKEIEAHLKTCEKCAEKLKNYRTEIQVDAKEATGADSKDKAVRDSMKKVKKKLSFRKAVAVISSLLLVVVVIGVGVLVYGERTGDSMNFTTISNIMTLKKAAKAACARDFEPMVTLTHYDLDETYLANRFIQEAGTTIPDLQREKLERAFRDTFGDAPVQFEIGGIEYGYENDFFSGISKEYTAMPDMMNPAGAVTVRFYNDKAQLNVMFYQNADRKFTYDDMRDDECKGKQNFSSIQCAELVPQLVAYNVKLHNDNLRVWNVLIRERPEVEKEHERDAAMDARLEQLAEMGWRIREFYMDADDFNFDQICIVYKAHFILKNEKGDMAMMEQRFDLQNDNFYIRENDPAVMTIKTDAMNGEAEDLALKLFAVQ